MNLQSFKLVATGNTKLVCFFQKLCQSLTGSETDLKPVALCYVSVVEGSFLSVVPENEDGGR